MRFQMIGQALQQIIDPSDGTLYKYVVEKATEKAKEEMKENFKGIIYTFLEAISETVMELIYSATLIGGGVLLILRVAGLKKGGRWCSVLYCSYALLHLLIGGAS